MNTCTKPKCRICLNYEKSDRGIILYNKKIKFLKKYDHFNNDDLVKTCSCQPSHKHCTFKKMLVDQCMTCDNCGDNYMVYFKSTDSLCTKIYHYRMMKEFVLFILIFFASIALLIVNSQYNYTPSFFFWKVFIYTFLGLLILFSMLLIAKTISRVSKEMFVSSVYLSGEDCETALRIQRKERGSKKSLIVDIVKDFTKLTVEKVDSKEKLHCIMGILMCDFGLSKKEILQVKVDNKNLKSVLRKKDYSYIIPQIDKNGVTIFKKGTLKESFAIKKSITRSDTLFFNKKETQKLHPTIIKKSTLTTIDDKQDNNKMLFIQEDITHNPLNNTTGIDLGITANKDRILSTNDLLEDRLNSEISALDKSGENRGLVLNISDDSIHLKKDRTLNLTVYDDSGLYLNSKENLID